MKKGIFLLSLMIVALSLEAQISVIPSSKSKQIPVEILGVNTQTIKGPGWDKQPFLDKITELNPGNLRYPGGTIGNFFDWETGYYNEIGQKINVIKPHSKGAFPYKLEDVKKVYDQSGATTQPVYMLNMLTATYDNQLQMLKHAQKIGLPVKYIEMGNEYYFDDDPKPWPYTHVYPDPSDYTDTCRIWIAKLRKEFPEAKFAMVGVNNPSAWKRPRVMEWNRNMMANMDGITCEAFTVHSYTKNNVGESATPHDMLEQTISSISAKTQNTELDDKYSLWVTEYNFWRNDNLYTGLWVHGLSVALQSALFINAPKIELICIHNLAAGVQYGLINDYDTNIGKKIAKQYELTAGGEAFKMLANAQEGQNSVRELIFATNPTIKTTKSDKLKSYYGWIYGNQSAFMVNVSDKAVEISTKELGFKASNYAQIYAMSLTTPVLDASTLSCEQSKITNSTVTLQPYSITIIK